MSRGQRLWMGEAAQGSAWASLQEVPTGAEWWGVGEAQRWGGLPILQRLIHGQMLGSGKAELDGCGEEGAPCGSTWRLGNPSS